MDRHTQSREKRIVRSNAILYSRSYLTAQKLSSTFSWIKLYPPFVGWVKLAAKTHVCAKADYRAAIWEKTIFTV